MSLPYPESKALSALAEDLAQKRIGDLNKADAARNAEFKVQAAGIQLDFNGALLDRGGMAQLLSLAASAELPTAREQLFDGSLLNNTEQRAVGHCLLRSSEAPAGLEQEYAEVQACMNRMRDWVDAVHSGDHRGYSDLPVSHVVNLGIGGSDLGPRMVCQALADCELSKTQVHFCANVDPDELNDLLKALPAEQTLFIICSKTMTTEETLSNTERARQWLLDEGCPEGELAKHLLAVSTNTEKAAELGIPEANMLPMWDWVGGRFSLWSAVGLSIAFAIGYDGFRRLLDGAAAMDQHFRRAPLESNLPVLLSLLEIWYVNFLGANNYAVLPYSHRLRRLPAFLQQLTMESNGKQVNRSGQPVDYNTAPVLWGEAGSNGQHSFHQLLHQGTVMCPIDLILIDLKDPHQSDARTRLYANGLAQARAFTFGRTETEARASLLQRGVPKEEAQQLASHLAIPGNRPCHLISLDELSPETVGALIALYEHRTFCSGHLWQINSFDQYGVELGKVLSKGIYQELLNPR